MSLPQYSKSPTYEGVPLQERVRKSIRVSLGTQVTQVMLSVKNLPATAGGMRDSGSIPVSERSPGGVATHSSFLAWGVPWREEPGHGP